ncbi:MAG TPA: S-adenosylmethionine decarboxylase [Candidatus Caenarcaniphilales bacterium]|jgi:S-adenosylmethionine decarboxylase
MSSRTYPYPPIPVLRSHHAAAILTASQAIFKWTEADFLALLRKGAQQAQLTVVGELAFTFDVQGITAVVLLKESHVALHFWPEEKRVTIDIHICDYQQDNGEKAEILADFLALQITGGSSGTQWYNLTITN